MRTSQYFICTLKEIPADAETISHQLMLRAGLIRKLAAGLYTWLPLGLKVLRRVEKIIREEMDRAGAIEVLMPAIQPAELWQETGRWDKFGPQLLKIEDRHQRYFCFGPTHEEVITDLVRREVHSYRQLPLNFFQIQTKFRDEIRPRFGVMRAREFIMKDAYSFHLDEACLVQTYQQMYEAYVKIFTRLGLDFRAVLADTGSIGGNASHEFHVLAASGEDQICFSDSSDYAANIELAEALAPTQPRLAPSAVMSLVDTPHQKSISEVCAYLHVSPTQVVKTLLVKGTHHPVIALLLRGDHELNEVKAEKIPAIASPVCLIGIEQIQALLGCEAGFIGPVDLPDIPVIADRSVMVLADFICGANQTGKHYQHVNWERDIALPEIADLRKVLAGDPSPDGQGQLAITRGIEVGHIFQLGLNYSTTMGACVRNVAGQEIALYMGCYGIGVSRIVAAAIEQNHDEQGILWPGSLAPFSIALIAINWQKSPALYSACEDVYQQLVAAGYDVLWDDRQERPGVLFADMDLLGIPHRLVLSERTLAEGAIEYRARRDGTLQTLPLANVLSFVKERIVLNH